ncbi:hypothetical protein K7432_005600 [Basidiobolus ranarum]|uniref:Uncharacterized protein n=1 Tax=Basidiobolus ranarum TaxID=34480 RepID=A0ABR2WW83_9FUNG
MKQFSHITLISMALLALNFMAAHGAPTGGNYQTTNTDNNAATIFCSIFRLNCNTACKSQSGTGANECSSTGTNSFRYSCVCKNGNDATSQVSRNTPTRSTTNPSYYNVNLGQNGNGNDYCNKHKGRCQDVCRNASPNNWRQQQDCKWKKDSAGAIVASGLCACNRCDIAYTVAN